MIPGSYFHPASAPGKGQGTVRTRAVAEVVRRQETPSGETTPTSPAAREANAHRVNAPPIGLIQPLP